MRVTGADFSLRSSLRNLWAQKDAPGRRWTGLRRTPARGSAPQGQLPHLAALLAAKGCAGLSGVNRGEVWREPWPKP